jgi:hypothetical protein
MPPCLGDSFSITPVVEQEVFNCLLALSRKKLTGCENISTFNLRKVIHLYSSPLPKITNKRFSSGIFPDLNLVKVQNISGAVGQEEGHDVGQEKIDCFWATLVIMYQNVWRTVKPKICQTTQCHPSRSLPGPQCNAAQPRPGLLTLPGPHYFLVHNSSWPTTLPGPQLILAHNTSWL